MTFFQNFREYHASRYKYRDQVINDANRIIARHTNLKPEMKEHIYNDGTVTNIVCLSGTIAVNYQNQTYNIPVELFLPEMYPVCAPIVYVRPTSTMNVRPNRNVEASGHVMIPYLTQWRQSDSRLERLVEILQATFGQESPVFRKTNSSSRPQPPMPPQHPGYPPAIPPQNPSSIGSAWGGGGVGGGGPSPYMPGYPPAPHLQQSQPQQSSGMPAYPPHYPVPPPRPQQPSQQLPSSSFQHNQGSAANSNTTPLPSNNPAMRASLLTACSEKLRRLYKENYGAKMEELEKLRASHDALLANRERIQQMIEKLGREDVILDQNIKTFETALKNGEEVLQKFEAENAEQPETKITAKYPIFEQLVEAYSRMQSVDELIAWLTELHDKNKISLPKMLELIRNLAKEKFRCRLVVLKCRETTGLAVQ